MTTAAAAAGSTKATATKMVSQPTHFRLASLTGATVAGVSPGDGVAAGTAASRPSGSCTVNAAGCSSRAASASTPPHVAVVRVAPTEVDSGLHDRGLQRLGADAP